MLECRRVPGQTGIFSGSENCAFRTSQIVADIHFPSSSKTEPAVPKMERDPNPLLSPLCKRYLASCFT